MKPKILILLFLSSTFFFTANAQNADKHPPCKEKSPMYRIPNLTEAQQTKITEIRTAHMKISNELRNQLREKKAHLKTLTLSDNPDQKAIDSTIDEITTLQNQLMKNTTAMRMEIREQLTDEQKVFYDSHMQKRKKAVKMK